MAAFLVSGAHLDMQLILDTLPDPISYDFGSQLRQPPFSQFLARLHTMTPDILLTSILELAQIASTNFDAMMSTSTCIATSMRPLFCSSTHAPGCCCCSPR